jgi:hypothetical protein
VEELLLLRLVPAEAREAAGNAGKQRRPWRWSAGTASPASSNGEERDKERMSGRFQWLVCAPWRARGAFYRPERSGVGVSRGEVRQTCVLAPARAATFGACWRARQGSVVMSGVCWRAGTGAAAGYRGEQARAAAAGSRVQALVGESEQGTEGDGEGWLGTAESKNSRKGAGIHYCK